MAAEEALEGGVEEVQEAEEVLQAGVEEAHEAAAAGKTGGFTNNRLTRGN